MIGNESLEGDIEIGAVIVGDNDRDEETAVVVHLETSLPMLNLSVTIGKRTSDQKREGEVRTSQLRRHFESCLSVA